MTWWIKKKYLVNLTKGVFIRTCKDMQNVYIISIKVICILLMYKRI